MKLYHNSSAYQAWVAAKGKGRVLLWDRWKIMHIVLLINQISDVGHFSWNPFWQQKLWLYYFMMLLSSLLTLSFLSNGCSEPNFINFDLLFLVARISLLFKMESLDPTILLKKGTERGKICVSINWCRFSFDNSFWNLFLMKFCAENS